MKSHARLRNPYRRRKKAPACLLLQVPTLHSSSQMEDMIKMIPTFSQLLPTIWTLSKTMTTSIPHIPCSQYAQTKRNRRQPSSKTLNDTLLELVSYSVALPKGAPKTYSHENPCEPHTLNPKCKPSVQSPKT